MIDAHDLRKQTMHEVNERGAGLNVPKKITLWV